LAKTETKLLLGVECEIEVSISKLSDPCVLTGKIRLNVDIDTVVNITRKNHASPPDEKTSPFPPALLALFAFE
jgi:hypothetical protein